MVATLHPQAHQPQFDRMAKLNIDFVLLDESVVMYGFRALMTGAQLEAFQKNPVMLMMHARAEAGYAKPLDQEAVLPIGKWYDIRVEGDKLLAKPEFDDDDEYALRIQKKVEKGYLNAASVWIDPIAATDEETLMLPGQVGPTITKWGLFEASIVDIPNCKNALAIRNSAGKKVALNADAENGDVLTYLTSLIPQSTNMDKKLMAVKLGLPETATDNEISTKLAAVMAENAKLPGLNEEITKLKVNVTNLSTENEALKKEASEKKIGDLVDGAITAKKLTAGEREKWLKLAAADFETTKELIESMKAFESVETRLAAGENGANPELAELLKLSGRELYMQGKFNKLKALSLEQFKLKYKEYFGTDYKV